MEGSMRSRQLGICVQRVALSLALTMLACNIFTPRSAEPPDKPAEWNAFPNTPEKCLENLIYAYNHRENVFLYGNILSDDFVFYFDSQDVLDFTLPPRWYKQNEVDMLMNVYFQTNMLFDMNLRLEVLANQPDIYHANYAWVYRGYKLYVNHNIPNLFTEFIGKFQLYMERESNGIWKIKEWHDFREQSEWTFGRMKNAFSS